MGKHSIHPAEHHLKQVKYERHFYNTWRLGRMTLDNFNVDYSTFLIMTCWFLF